MSYSGYAIENVKVLEYGRHDSSLDELFDRFDDWYEHIRKCGVCKGICETLEEKLVHSIKKVKPYTVKSLWHKPEAHFMEWLWKEVVWRPASVDLYFTVLRLSEVVDRYVQGYNNNNDSRTEPEEMLNLKEYLVKIYRKMVCLGHVPKENFKLLIGKDKQ